MIEKYEIKEVRDVEEEFKLPSLGYFFLNTNKGTFGLRRDYVAGKEIPFKPGQTIYVWADTLKNTWIILSEHKELLYYSEEYRESLREGKFLEGLVEMLNLAEKGFIDLRNMIYC